jgi:methylenetetrahydrofolate dehydrogenase (NADP+) / methenyltetrahydrofolate cyclohydrolase
VVDGNEIAGTGILTDVRRAYERYRSQIAVQRKRVLVIRVAADPGDPPVWQARTEASRISARQKIRNFSWAGLDAREVVLPAGIPERAFARLIERANTDPAMTAVVVQLPIAERLRHLVHGIAPEKGHRCALRRTIPVSGVRNR